MGINWQDCRVIAHRGASAVAPENTITALKKAASLGAKWVESDVILTADLKPIIFHDEKLERTTNGVGWVDQQPYAAIRQLDAGSWFSEEFKGEKVPSLSEWLQCAAKLNLSLNLELKAQPKMADELAECLIQALQAHWPKPTSNLLISSFSAEHLQAVRRLDKTLNLAYLCERWSEGYLPTLQELGCVSVNINAAYAQPEVIDAIGKHGYQVLVYTVDDLARAHHLFELGVAGIFSNHPDLI